MCSIPGTQQKPLDLVPRGAKVEYSISLFRSGQSCANAFKYVARQIVESKDNRGSQLNAGKHVVLLHPCRDLS